jgi:hypothetical protein
VVSPTFIDITLPVKEINRCTPPSFPFAQKERPGKCRASIEMLLGFGCRVRFLFFCFPVFAPVVRVKVEVIGARPLKIMGKHFP